MKKYFTLFWKALQGKEENYTTGSIDRAIFLLSIPMILEMIMESLFAIVDIYFVSKISLAAVTTVGLTESVLTLIYAVAIGFSVGATAMVARRAGEKDWDGVNKAIGQVLCISIITGVVLGLAMMVFAKDILLLMGADHDVVSTGLSYTKVLFLSTPSIILLYSLSGALRGSGKPAVAMQSLWIANGINMALIPAFIFGWSFIPSFGVTGAAIATSIGRTVGVIYQLYYLAKGKNALRWRQLIPQKSIMLALLNISSGGMGQYIISSASWLFLIRILAEYGSETVAGYTIAIRIIIFAILPASGIANAASTLVGQNLGANQAARAQQSVWKTAKYNFILLFTLGVFIFWQAEELVRFFTQEEPVIHIAVQALRIISLGYPFYAYGMVMIQSLNGAGDSKTPILINVICFWLLEIPLAYLLAVTLDWQAVGVFVAIPIAESLLAVLALFYFRTGRWKRISI